MEEQIGHKIIVKESPGKRSKPSVRFFFEIIAGGSNAWNFSPSYIWTSTERELGRKIKKF